jgi:hypothetical protein
MLTVSIGGRKRGWRCIGSIRGTKIPHSDPHRVTESMLRMFIELPSYFRLRDHEIDHRRDAIRARTPSHDTEHISLSRLVGLCRIINCAEVRVRS